MWENGVLPESRSMRKNISAGLAGGACAAMVSVVTSLPLESPNDGLFNSASVGLTSLAVGGIIGLLWNRFPSDRKLNRRYAYSSATLLLIAVTTAGSMQMLFDDAIKFTVPLAIIVVVTCTVMTPVLAINNRTITLLHGVLVLAAVVLSISFAGHGDQESGSLLLPPAR
jgi:drug/metabolite transporter (DMT)-like permease